LRANGTMVFRAGVGRRTPSVGRVEVGTAVAGIAARLRGGGGSSGDSPLAGSPGDSSLAERESPGADFPPPAADLAARLILNLIAFPASGAQSAVLGLFFFRVSKIQAHVEREV